MEKKSDWPLHLAAGVFLSTLITIVLWQPIRGGLCPKSEDFLKQTFSQNCADFLLNRYQTLIVGIGAIIAAALAAWLAWRGVQQQIALTSALAIENEKQAVKEAIVHGIALLQRLERHLKNLRDARDNAPIWETLDATLANANLHGIGAVDSSLQNLLRFCGPKVAGIITVMSETTLTIGQRYEGLRRGFANVLRVPGNLPRPKPPFEAVITATTSDINVLRAEIEKLRSL